MKTDGKHDRLISRGFFILAVLGAASLLPPAYSAEKDDEYLISLPEKKPATQAAKSSAEETPVRVLANADQLRGVLYDFKQTSDGKPTYLMRMQGGKQFNRLRTAMTTWNLPDGEKEFNMIPFLKQFVLSNWQSRINVNGDLVFQDLARFDRSTVPTSKSYIYQPPLESSSAPGKFSGDDGVDSAGWVGIYSGYVVAPFTGKFRFAGYGDDALVVHFDRQLVLDYGCYALSVGSHLGDSWDYVGILGGTADRTDPQKRMVLSNPLYSKCKLERYFPSMFDNRGVAKGLPLDVVKGRVYPIDVLVADIEDNTFCAALFIEQLNPDGTPETANPTKLPLFRTTAELPDHPGGGFPDFDEFSPVWKVVDSKGKPATALVRTAQEPAPKEKKPAANASASAPASAPTTAAAVPHLDPPRNSKEDLMKKPGTNKNSNSKKEQPARDPNLVKTVSSTTRGSTTYQTITEYDGDSEIVTEVVTEHNRGMIVETTTVTEKKGGKVVRKTKNKTTRKEESSSSSRDKQTKSIFGRAGDNVSSSDGAANGNASAKPSATGSGSTSTKPAASSSAKPASSGSATKPATTEKPAGTTAPVEERKKDETPAVSEPMEQPREETTSDEGKKEEDPSSAPSTGTTTNPFGVTDPGDDAGTESDPSSAPSTGTVTNPFGVVRPSGSKD